MFMSGKLIFPNDSSQEHRFGYENLQDLGEIGRGRYGRVNKMIYIPTGNFMAIKVLKTTSIKKFLMILKNIAFF